MNCELDLGDEHSATMASDLVAGIRRLLIGEKVGPMKRSVCGQEVCQHRGYSLTGK